MTVTLTVVVAVSEPLVPVTVITYVPAVVPELPPPPPPLLPLEPQPMPNPTIAAKTSMPRRVRQLRRRAGIPKKSRQATAMPPPAAKNLSSGCWRAPLVAAVVKTVRVEVVDVLDGLRLQVGIFEAPLGELAIEQLRATLLENPLAGTTVMVEVVFPPGLTPAALLLVSVKLALAAAVTVTLMVAFSVRFGVVDVPVTAMV